MGQMSASVSSLRDTESEISWRAQLRGGAGSNGGQSDGAAGQGDGAAGGQNDKAAGQGNGAAGGQGGGGTPPPDPPPSDCGVAGGGRRMSRRQRRIKSYNSQSQLKSGNQSGSKQHQETTSRHGGYWYKFTSKTNQKSSQKPKEPSIG